jgi:hypothetical protein
MNSSQYCCVVASWFNCCSFGIRLTFGSSYSANGSEVPKVSIKRGLLVRLPAPQFNRSSAAFLSFGRDDFGHQRRRHLSGAKELMHRFR